MFSNAFLSQKPVRLLTSSSSIGRYFRSGVGRLALNRILFTAEEVADGFLIDASDFRAKHMTEVLRLEKGGVFKAGIANVGLANAKIENIGDQIHCSLEAELVQVDKPVVDLILACPRPLRLERLLPIIACIGVGKVVIVGGSKVVPDYFGSHLFRRPLSVQKALHEGLMQASCDYHVPDFIVRKRLDKLFSLSSLDELFPIEEYTRILAHPPIPSDSELHEKGLHIAEYSSNRFMDVVQSSKQQKIVVAVGPEGGWTAEEADSFLENQFHSIDLGSRILRTDIAVPILLAFCHEWIAAQKNKK